MINNDFSNRLSQYFANRAGKNDGAGQASDIYKKLKAKQDAMNGVGKDEKAAEQAGTEAAKDKTKKKGADTAELSGKSGKSGKSDKTAAKAEDSLTPEERRQKEVQAILDKINKESSVSNADAEKKAAEAAKAESVLTPDTDPKDKSKFLDFLNDMPLFNEFKTGLIEAFRSLDSATAGSISAQYELNYSSMQAIANSAGGFDYKEVNFSLKLDLNYIKAAGGESNAGKIADIIANADDMSSLISALSGGGDQKSQAANAAAAAAKTNPKDLMAAMQDYWSPEKTAGRIVDFATAFFPLSDAFKAKGDTEEAREEFAKTMRAAIQKGFDQAMGTLGAVPKKTQEGIDKTHELTFKGIDDFVKNGLNKQKEQEGIYDSLQGLFFSAQMTYSEKSVSVRSGSYNSTGQASPAQKASSIDAQA